MGKELKRFIISSITAAALYKLLWDTYIVMQGKWYAPLIYFGLVAVIYFVFKEGLKW